MPPALIVGLTLLVVAGLTVGGGERADEREAEGERDKDEQPSRPEHAAVEDDSAGVQLPRRPSPRTEPPD